MSVSNHWPIVCKVSIGDWWVTPQRASNAESASSSWRLHYLWRSPSKHFIEQNINIFCWIYCQIAYSGDCKLDVTYIYHYDLSRQWEITDVVLIQVIYPCMSYHVLIKIMSIFTGHFRLGNIASLYKYGTTWWISWILRTWIYIYIYIYNIYAHIRHICLEWPPPPSHTHTHTHTHTWMIYCDTVMLRTIICPLLR